MLIIWIFCVLLYAVAGYTGFAILNNDFLQVLKLSEYLQWTDISSYYNGIYPVGFVMMVKALSGTGHLLPSILVVLGLLSYALLARTMMVHLDSPLGYAALVAMILCGLDTLPFEYLICPGAYIPFMSCVGTGLIYLGIGHRDGDQRPAVIGTLFLLLAAEFRDHAYIFFGVSIVLLLLLRSSRQVLRPLVLGSIVYIVYRMVISYMATGSILTSGHALMVRMVDWSAITPYYEFGRMSLRQFVQFYLHHFMEHLLYLLPLVWYLFRSRSGRLLDFIAYVMVCYYFIIHAHPSVRGILPLIPWSYYYLLHMLLSDDTQAQWQRLSTYRRAALLSILAVIGGLSLLGGKAKNVKIARHMTQEYTQLEKVLRTEHPDIKAHQVYTNDFDLYLPDGLPATPYMNGGWARLSPSVYASYPNPRLHSTGALLSDLHDMGIRYIVVNEKFLRKQTSRYSTLSVLDSLPYLPELSQIEPTRAPFTLYHLEYAH